MKKVIKNSLLVLFSAMLFSCFTQRAVSDNTQKEKKSSLLLVKDTTSVKDTTEYELIVFDIGYDFWLESHSYVKNQHTNEYYKSMNQLIAQEWNRRYSSGDRLIDCLIDYDSRIEYGLDFNYRLYMYFKFFENRNKVVLVPGTGRIL